MKSKFPKVTYILFRENGKYVVKIYNPTKFKGHPVQIKRTTGEGSQRPAKRRALEIIDSFFADDGQAAIKSSTATVSDMLNKYHETTYLQNIKKRDPIKKKRMLTGMKCRMAFLHKHIGQLNPKTLGGYH